MRKGTCFYEGVLNESLAPQHIDFLIQNEFSHLEFTVHPKLMPLHLIKKHIRTWIDEQKKISFHMPSFVDPVYAISPEGMSDSQMTELLRYFDWLLETCHAYGSPIDLVFHGAESSVYTSDGDLFAATCRGFDRLLNSVVQKDMPLRLLLENTCPKDALTETFDAVSLEKLIRLFDTDHFGLCIDLAHWWRSHPDALTAYTLLNEANQLLTSKTAYYHLHGISSDLSKSHLSRKNCPIEYIEFVKAVSSKNPNKIFSLEIFEFKDVEKLATYETELLQWV